MAREAPVTRPSWPHPSVRRRTLRMTGRIFFGVAVILLTVPSFAQDETSIDSFFTGKQVIVKIDMPGTQQGVDLRFDKPSHMDWKQYSSRLKKFGPAIRQGDTARATTVLVKKNMIEFQLDGGGFGTFLDDSNTTVNPRGVDKSSYEKQLERDLASEQDPDRKRALQRDLDRERSRRERQESDNRNAAAIESQIKAQRVAENRTRGGSRFNLRWPGAIPQEDLTPESVMKLLAAYLEFPAQTTAPLPQQSEVSPGLPAVDTADSSSTARLQRGMQRSDVTAFLGEGKVLSTSVSPDGLTTEIHEYLAGDRRAEVTYVDGVVVRFSINSR